MALSGMIGQARVDCVDYDDIDPAVADEVYISKINKYYLLWHKTIEKRITEVTATAGGLTFTANTTKVTATPTNWYEVAKAYRVSAVGSIYGTPLEILPLRDILRKQSEDATTGTIASVAFERLATATAANIGKYNVYVHPIPSTTQYIGCLVRAWPTLLSASTDTPDISDLASYTISKLAAAEIAGLLGEDDAFIQNILRPIPDETLAALGVARAGYKPAPPETVTV